MSHTVNYHLAPCRSRYQAADGVAATMAVVNRTRDSFYDQGATFDLEAALNRALKCVDEGAQIIDIGGLSSGTGPSISHAEEISRVVPLISAIREVLPDVHISIDTWRTPVAEAALKAGATIVNDTWGGYEPGIIDLAGEYGAGYVCSHSGGAVPKTAPPSDDAADGSSNTTVGTDGNSAVGNPVDDIVSEVIRSTTALARRAEAAGIPRDAILLDAAHDIGKGTAAGLQLLARIDELVATGYPVMIAVSNKTFIGDTLGRDTHERLAGTLAATAWAVARGVSVVRAHNVPETVDTCRMTAALSRVTRS